MRVRKNPPQPSVLTRVRHTILAHRLEDAARCYQHLRGEWEETFQAFLDTQPDPNDLSTAQLAPFKELERRRGALWYPMYRLHLDNEWPEPLQDILLRAQQTTGSVRPHSQREPPSTDLDLS